MNSKQKVDDHSKLAFKHLLNTVKSQDEKLLKTTIHPYKSELRDDQLHNLLSDVYENLMITNIDVGSNISVIEHQLLDYNYNLVINGGYNKSNIKPSSEKDRLQIMMKCVDLILNSPFADDYQVDQTYLFLLSTISKHCFLLSKPELDKFAYIFDMFILIQLRGGREQYQVYRLIIDKYQIYNLMIQFQIALHQHSKELFSIIIERYFEVTKLETDTVHWGIKFHLNWRFKNAIGNKFYNNTLPELMRILNRLKKFQLMKRSEVEAIKTKQSKALSNYIYKDLELEIIKIKKEFIQKNSNKDREKYKLMLKCFYELSHCGNPNNKLTKLIKRADSSPITSPFDDFILRINLLLVSDTFTSDELNAIKSEITGNLETQSLKASIKFKVDKRVNKKINKLSSRLKNWHALSNILYHIDNVDSLIFVNITPVEAFAIRRVIHVIGEFIKTTKQTKNLSVPLKELLKRLNQCKLFEDTENIRNQLSHNYSLRRLLEMEKLNTAVYKGLQEDLINIKSLFANLIYIEGSKVYRTFLNKICKCKNGTELKSLSKYIEKVSTICTFNVNKNAVALISDLKETVLPDLMRIQLGDPVKQQFVKQNEETIMKGLKVLNIFFEHGPFNVDVAEEKQLIKFNDNISRVRLIVISLINSPLYYRDNNYVQCLGIITDIQTCLSNVMIAIDTELPETASKLQTFINKFVGNFGYLKNINKLMYPLLDSKDKNLHAYYMEKDIADILKKCNIYDDLKAKHASAVIHGLLNANKRRSVTSIYYISEKYAVIQQYSERLDVKNLPAALRAEQRNEEMQIQEIFENKILLLNDLIQAPKSNIHQHFAIEYLLLEILEMMNETILQNNMFQLEEVGAILCGRNLRNYLAHGNVCYKIATFHGSSSIKNIVIANCIHIYERREQFKLFENKSHKKLTTNVNLQSFEGQLKLLRSQEDLFKFAQQLDVMGCETAIEQGATFDGRNYDNQNLFQNFLQQFQSTFEEFLLQPNIRQSQVNAIRYIMDNIPSIGKSNKNLQVEAIPHNTDFIETQLLHEACSIGCYNAVALACTKKINLNCSNGDWTPLRLACRRNYTEIISLLVENLSDTISYTDVLVTMVQSNNFEVFKLIIPKCKDLNAVLDENNHRILHTATIFNSELKIFEYLIERGAEVTAKDTDGMSIHHHAAYYGRCEIIKCLVKRGYFEDGTFDWNDRDNFGNTPLILAATNGHSKVINLLLQQNVDLTLTNENEVTALQQAVGQNHEGIARRLLPRMSKDFFNPKISHNLYKLAINHLNMNLVNFFLKHGLTYDYNPTDMLMCTMLFSSVEFFHKLVELYGSRLKNFHDILDGVDSSKVSSLLHKALQQNNLEVIKKLIEYGADYSNRNKSRPRGFTVLHEFQIVPNASTPILEYFIGINCDINATDDFGLTPLYYAVVNSEIVNIYVLLKNGADISIRDADGDTLAHIVCYNGELDILKMLLDFGAGNQLLTLNNENRTPEVCALCEGHGHMIAYLQNKK